LGILGQWEGPADSPCTLLGLELLSLPLLLGLHLLEWVRRGLDWRRRLA
jgi:hypothetical protein